MVFTPIITRGKRRLLEDPYEKLDPILDLNSGEDDVPRNRWIHLKNVSNTRATGHMATSRGYARCNSTDLGAAIDGFITFYKDLTTTERLFIYNGGLYKVTNDWESITQINDSATGLPLVLTAGKRTMFATATRPGRRILFINEADGLYVYDGADATKVDIPKAGGGAGNITGARYVMFHPNGRVVVGCNTTDADEEAIIYYSEAWASTVLPVFTVGTANGGFITLYHGRDSLINTGLGHMGDDIISWTESGMYRSREWDKFDADAQPLAARTKEICAEGNICPYATQRYENYWIWVSRNGVFAWNGGIPRCLTRDIFPGASLHFKSDVASLLGAFAVIHDDEYRLTYNDIEDNVSRNSRTWVYNFAKMGWYRRYNTPFRCGYSCEGGADLLQQLYYGSDDATKGYIWRWGETDNLLPTPSAKRNKTVYVDDYATMESPVTGDSIEIEAKRGWSDFGDPGSLKIAEFIEIEYDQGDGYADLAQSITNGKIYFYADDVEAAICHIVIPDNQNFQRLYFPEMQIQDEEFTGSGLDDLTSGGTYSGASPFTYRIQIDGTGTPDTFKWSKDGGTTWEAETVNITGAAQTLDNGVQVTFAATTGHTLGDYWEIETAINLFFRKYKLMFAATCNNRAIIFKSFKMYARLIRVSPDET